MTHYHIVGIGGAGMSGIAQILLDQGHVVSGSDARDAPVLRALAERGALVQVGHQADQVAGADALVSSSAVRADHPELQAARARGIPLLRRHDLWRQWSAQRPVAAVAGTHGKTTTTAMLALILTRAGRDPGFLVGGDAPDLGSSARWGRPDAPLVLEADEYDRTFLALTPQVAVMTNVEWDHVDIYQTPEDYAAAFAQFAASVPQPQNLVLCDDDEGLRRAVDVPGATFYGLDETLATDPVSCRLAPLDYTASGVRGDAAGTRFDLWRYDRRTFARRRLPPAGLLLSGAHNVRNALAALAAAERLGVPPEQSLTALAAFRGTGRRFELKGEAGGVTVIDDYAHHPTETRATLAAARMRFGDRRLVAYLQPHTYSRTKALLAEWGGALDLADAVLVGAIYAARETDTLGVDAALLARHLAHPQARATGDLRAAADDLLTLLRPGDVLLTLGAGDGSRVGEIVLETLRAA